jgi:Mg-chelatase subunit ChlD
LKILCVYCGGEFSIRAEDLGGRGYCPHCHKAITLPKAAPTSAAPEVRPQRQRPVHWIEGSLSGMISLVLHMVLFLVIALWQSEGGRGGGDAGEEVLIGLLPVEELVERPEEQLAVEEVQKQQAASLELDAPAPPTSAAAASEGDLAATLSASGGAAAANFDLGAVQVGGAAQGGGSWEGLLGSLRKSGLDIVLCFDSTGSMGGEIDQVKRQIERIGQILTKLVPKARISICTYRDRRDEYVAKGLPLTSSIQDVSEYLATIEAGGGGDHEEAVEEGLSWAMTQNRFRPAARKVILVFGDAPPHRDKLRRCVDLATEFRQQHKGIVSTVTCRNDRPLPEFYEIAAAGGGEAFLTENQREIMSQLIVLVFGSQHRQKVLEAFELLGK